MAGGEHELWPVRCRYLGVARYDRATQATTYEGLDVTVEGFDVATGNTTWSVPLGAAEAFLDERTATASESEVLLQGATGPVIVDLGDGSSRPPGTAEAFWCATAVSFGYGEAWHHPAGSTNERRGGDVLDPCAADGSPTTALPAHLPRAYGARVGERVAVATPRGLVAYDRGRR